MAVSDAARHVSYESFFGFHEAPFGLAPNTRFRFASASHQAALAEVTHALQRRDPIIVVTGDIGTGKTLLCRTVVEQLDRKTFLSVISDPMLGRDDLLKQMLQDFGIISKDRAQITPASRADLVHALNDFLVSLAPLGAHAVVVLDEAQHAQPEVLEEIRLLSNAQDDRGTMLQIMLVGQADLESLLTRPELQPLKERISRHVRLEPLSADEVSRYIEHRIGVARERHPRASTPGARELERELAEWNGAATGVTFAPTAIARIAEVSHGIPRRINLLCDRALEYTFLSQSWLVDSDIVDSAVRALQLDEPRRPGPPERVAIAGHEPDAFDFPTATATTDYKGVVAGAIAAGVLAMIVASWVLGRSINRDTNAEAPPISTETQSQPPAPPPAPAAQPAAVDPAPEPPSGSQGRQPATSASPVVERPLSDTFDIVVASFRTSTRATAVAADIGALGQPVRQRVANGWHQVLAGPFRSRSQADQAQQQLQRAGFAGTQIVVTER